MPRFVLTGGRQRSGATDTTRMCDAAVVLELDTDDRSVRTRLLYESPADVRAGADASVLFKSGHATAEHVYLCTTTEVLVCDAADLDRVVHYVSLPCFNDVHHVRPAATAGNLVVVSTGVDTVYEIDPAGAVHSAWPVVDGAAEAYDPSVDYRRVLSTKPHLSHPNHVFYRGDQLFVNRCHQRDFVDVETLGQRIDYGDLGAVGHDGVVTGDRVHLTSVNGFVAELDLPSGDRLRTLDLNEATKASRPLGWCRGIAVVDDASWLVGFTRIRPTRWRENLSWVKSRVTDSSGPKLPTRVACYDPNEGRLRWELDLEEHGMGELFSILPVDASTP